ncbi:hypothetical protein PFICI_12737 [Pestalotiopsis fici W106-1]|uniref:FAD-binding domain-containing protein n=1 Tax=Pestalotiopsis fici (strain W106-1 / CGMCC3.15140) TaxID=1229662 RepID=W3WPL1_PESFW|nr:uncharacterized protein PFICI_12737 [Pestalotiopsis fici W106-1]ETS75793.1 hypothetical protein PFICI_12737 [Pestalotiopsis fici W106-1]
MSLIQEQKKLRIAVVGVGMAGVAAGLDLRDLPNVDVQLYERSTEHRLAGAWLGVTPSALRRLVEWVDEEAVDRVMTRRYNPFTALHWSTGEVLHKPQQVDGAKLSKAERLDQMGVSNAIRSELHQLTVALLPQDMIHAGKKSLGLEQTNGAVRIKFEDGTDAVADLVIAADGINSGIRKAFDPDYTIKYLGHLVYTCFWDYEKLKQEIPDLPEDDVVMYCGNCLVFMGYVGYKQYALELIVPEEMPETQTVRWNTIADEARMNHLLEYFKDWNPIINQFLRVSMKHDIDMVILPRSRGQWSPSMIANQQIAFIGDAAHPTAGAFSSGTSFAWEDSKTLSLALGHAYQKSKQWNTETVGTALKLYDDILSTHYKKVYQQVEKFEAAWNNDLEDMALNFSAENIHWITNHDADEAFAKWVKEHSTE